jgi:hypothetical protein
MNNTSFYHGFGGSNTNMKLSPVCPPSLHNALSTLKLNNGSKFLIAPSIHIKTPKSGLQSDAKMKDFSL